MGKAKASVFFCQECGYESAKWMGQCPGCHEWNTFVEELIPKSGSAISAGRQSENKKPVPLSQVEMTKQQRISSGIGELDRVLGGGIVPGSLVLVGGDTRIGK